MKVLEKIVNSRFFSIVGPVFLLLLCWGLYEINKKHLVQQTLNEVRGWSRCEKTNVYPSREIVLVCKGKIDGRKERLVFRLPD
jgi:hypothetical protein